MSDDARIAAALAHFREQADRGTPVTPEELVAEYPEVASELRTTLHALSLLDRAYGRTVNDRRADERHASVLEFLSKTGSSITPVVLRETVAEELSPVVIPPAVSTTVGRYTLLGEIARGGVGVVLKARDPDLGRDVAIKVLRAEHATNPDVVCRFVEEAQVGGQLQHPGIVPVHELGLRTDGTPFFAMKLIKGRTLAALLAERPSPSDERVRFLSIFESVCNTIAYAHARGIVHRDLKPSNVMVGAFGEVQVVDWGMAKVLSQGGVADEAQPPRVQSDRTRVSTVRTKVGSTQSVVGSVFGTPRYMAPEQARGEVDRIDERTDVFALGGILCEVLTGDPPYAGDDDEVLEDAALGRVEDARGRLAASGASSDLVRLADLCLSPAMEVRPRDAGVVARGVTSHRAASEERERQALLAATEARVKVEEERKRRRLAILSAAAVVALVIVLAGGWMWIDARRRGRANAIRDEVAAALGDASLARGKAVTSGTDLALWSDALGAARRAAAVARSGDGDDATRVRAAEVLATLEAEVRAAEAAIRESEENRRLVERLEAIRLTRADHQSYSRSNLEYESVMREYGIELSANGDTGTVAERVRTSPISLAVVSALDDWRSVRKYGGFPVASLDAVLSAADTDPWRTRLRAATGVEELRALVRNADLDAVHVVSLIGLVRELAAAGDPTAAADFAVRVQARYPHDFGANNSAGRCAGECRPPRTQAVIRYFSAALALRPQSAMAWGWLGKALTDAKDATGGLVAFRTAIRLASPSDIDLLASAHCHVGICRALQGAGDAAVAESRRAIRLKPGDILLRCALCTALRDNGDIEAAIAEARDAIRLSPETALAHAELGRALQTHGDLAGAIDAFREAVRLEPNTMEGHYLLGASLLVRGDLDGAIVELRAAMTLEPTAAEPVYNLGKLLGMRDDIEGAIAAYRDAIRLKPDFAEAHCNLGSCLGEVGQLAESLDEWRTGHRLGTLQPDWKHPTAQWVQRAERWLDLERVLDAAISGTMTPDRGDWYELARIARSTQRSAGAAAIVARALVADPTTADVGPPEVASRLDHPLRHLGACAAALAGTGRGRDAVVLDEPARTGWRKQAVAWLRTDLAAQAARLDKGSGHAAGVHKTIQEWTRDPDLAGIRDEAMIEELPPGERSVARAFWSDVDALLRRTQ